MLWLGNIIAHFDLFTSCLANESMDYLLCSFIEKECVTPCKQPFVLDGDEAIGTRREEYVNTVTRKYTEELRREKE